jgi:hypothetical protein
MLGGGIDVGGTPYGGNFFDNTQTVLIMEQLKQVEVTIQF